MGTTFICFSLKSISTSVNSDILEKDYGFIYKPILQFLYSHSEFPFSLSITGSQIEFLKKRKNESVFILRQLIERKQVEVLGGGYYDPVMPLIGPVDRNGQIDSLSTELRQTLGKRPRGITLHSDVWDASLVNNIHTCGIEYVLLDSSLIPENKQQFLPLIMTDFGKSVDIYPYYSVLNPVPDMSPEVFINRIRETVSNTKIENPVFQKAPDRVVNINLTHNEMYNLVCARWFGKFYDYIKGIDDVKLTTPYLFKKDTKVRIPAYIPAGLNSSVRKYIGLPFKENNIESRKSSTIFDFFETYQLNHSLYCRMVYVSMLVNQYKNDKMRKKVARDRLWQAQNGSSFVWSDIDVKSNFKNRQKAYRYLMESEKILREDGRFKEAINSFDYDNDGFNEYVCRMDDFFTCISLVGGGVRELELIKNTGNYADNLSRLVDFDGCEDGYRRGFFVDHLFTEEQFEQYLNNKFSGDGVFSNIQYNELKYSQSKREVHLGVSSVLKETKQSVYLKKKYIINSTGLYVQYILRNDSDSKLKAKFAVESNFACLNYGLNNNSCYNFEVVANNQKFERNDGECYSQNDNEKSLRNVSFVRVTDIDNNISFVYEPNEKCGYCSNDIEFCRPDYKKENIPVEKTFVSTLFWDVEIDPGRETEKNINFTILVKKNKKN